MFFIKDHSSNKVNFKKLPKHEDLEEINGSLVDLAAKIKGLKLYNVNIHNENDFYFFSQTNLRKKVISFKDFLFSANDFLIIKNEYPLVKVNSNRLALKLIGKVGQSGKIVFSPVKKVNFI